MMTLTGCTAIRLRKQADLQTSNASLTQQLQEQRASHADLKRQAEALETEMAGLLVKQVPCVCACLAGRYSPDAAHQPSTCLS